MQLDLSILNVLATTQDGWNWQVKLINKAKGKSIYSTLPSESVESYHLLWLLAFSSPQSEQEAFIGWQMMFICLEYSMLYLDQTSSSYAHTIHFRPGSNSPPKPYSQNGLCSSSSNWILMSCQPHRVTSGQSNSGHKQIHISKLFSHTYQLSVKSVQNQSLCKHKHTSAPVTYQQSKEGQ